MQLPFSPAFSPASSVNAHKHPTTTTAFLSCPVIPRLNYPLPSRPLMELCFSPSLLVFPFLFISFFSVSAISHEPPQLLRLPQTEQEAVYLALESVNPAINWRSLYPDDLCLYGPHGVICDIFPHGPLHITELNFGYVSDFSSNPPCGPNATLPQSLSSLPFLRRVFFYACFTGETTSLSNGFWNLSTVLEDVVFIENPSLTGRLGRSLGRLPRLRRVVVSGSALSGDITDEMGNLLDLEQLVLSRNSLRGEIPASIGRCGRLKILDLSGNRLGGRIPEEIGLLKELVKLDLARNRISGPVQAEISQLQRLELLDLSHNQLTGGIPTALSKMTNLKEVYLSSNPLGGRIPEIWENLKGITGVGLSGLGLVGGIPSSMGVFLENICYLALDNNLLEGELPEQLKRLEATAREINLENNSFHGRIPFSADFVERIGTKLKLAGNPKLCLTADTVGRAERNRRGGLDYMELCPKTDVPHPALLSSGVSLKEISPFLFWFVPSLFLF